MNGQANNEKTWPCARLVEYTRLSNKHWLRAQLLAENRHKEAFVEKAMPIVREEVIAATLRADGTVGKQFIRDLRRKGYNDEMLSRALAEAWFAHHTHFTLPELENLGNMSLRLLRSLMLALLFVSPGLAYAFLGNLKPEIQVVFLPLLGVIAVLLTAAIYYLHKHHPHFRRH